MIAPRKPDFGFAELVRGRDEEGGHRADPSAHLRPACRAGSAIGGHRRRTCRPRQAARGRRAKAASSATSRRPPSPGRTRRPQSASWCRHCASAGAPRRRRPSASRRPPAPRASGRGPPGPAWSTSRAKTGSIAVAPPSSTANRSRLIAPSTSRLWRTYFRPSTICAHGFGPRPISVRATGPMASRPARATANRMALAAYGA